MTETTEATTGSTWLTQEAFDRLKSELAELETTGREEVVSRIAAAREEGDLRENGGYHAAKDEQGKLEARIRQLRQLLREAQVGEAPVTEAGIVGPGAVVTVRYLDEEEDEQFLLGSREDTGHGDLAVYSPAAPLGKALMGRRVGETISYQLPNGRQSRVRVQRVEPYQG